MITLEWEDVKSNHGEMMSRAKVFGGWLVKCVVDATIYLPDRGLTNGIDYRTSITFVPDPKHEWA